MILSNWSSKFATCGVMQFIVALLASMFVEGQRPKYYMGAEQEQASAVSPQCEAADDSCAPMQRPHRVLLQNARAALPLLQGDEDVVVSEHVDPQQSVEPEKLVSSSAHQKLSTRDEQDSSVMTDLGASVSVVGQDLPGKWYGITLVGQLVLALVVFGVFRYIRSKASSEKDKPLIETAGRMQVESVTEVATKEWNKDEHVDAMSSDSDDIDDRPQIEPDAEPDAEPDHSNAPYTLSQTLDQGADVNRH